MIRVLSFVLTALLTVSGASAQGITHSQEVEVGTDGLGGSFASDYIMFDTDRLNSFIRPFWVNDVLNRVEFGVGPTFKTGPLLHKLTFGFTTDRELMVAGLWIAKVGNRELMYIVDYKPAPGDTLTSLYQKAYYQLDGKGIVHARYEQLNIRSLGLIFVRPGVDVRIPFKVREQGMHIFVAPFYDPKNESPGVQVGLRFFGLKVR